jgi:PEGA domain
VSGRGTFFAALLAMTLLGTVAGAQVPDATSKRLFAAGIQAFDAGRYDVAIKAFETAYARTPSDLLVYDLAQAYNKKYVVEGDRAALDKAIELFRRFLASPFRGRERAQAGEALNHLLLLAARAPEARPAPVEAAPPKTEILIATDADNAEVALDDRPATPAPLLEVVSPGEHHARVTAPGYKPVELRVLAVEGRFVVSDARLVPLPGGLDVAGRKGAALELDGAAVGTLPLTTLPVEAGSHRIELTLPGFMPWRSQVEVGRGAQVHVRAQLSPTGRRRAVPWLGVAASAVGLAAIASGAVWGVADGEATSILRRQEQGPISRADVDAYDSARATRDRALIGTAVTLAVGAGLTLTSLGLYLFDRGR